MSVTLSLFAGAGAQFFDNNGNPLTGGKIYTYAAGTTTPVVTYTTNSDAAPHTNPIVLDSAGRVPSGGEIWLSTGVGYKFVVKTSTDVLIATYDNIPSSAQPPAANDADSIMYEQGYTVTAGSFVIGKTYRILTVGTTDFTLIGASSNTIGTHFIATGVGSGTGTAELSQTVEARLRQIVTVKDFGAVGDGVTDDTAAVQAALDSGATGVFVPAGDYLVTSSIDVPDYVNVLCSTGVKFTFDSTDFYVFGIGKGVNFFGNGVLLDCVNASWDGGAVFVDGVHRYADDYPAALDGINIQGVSTTKGTGLYLTATDATDFISFVRFSNFTFHRMNFGLTAACGSSGTAGDVNTWHWINGNVFENFNYYGTTYGINLSGLTTVPAEVNGNLFNNHSFQVSSTAIYLDGASGNTFSNIFVFDWNYASGDAIIFDNGANANIVFSNIRNEGITGGATNYCQTPIGEFTAPRTFKSNVDIEGYCAVDGAVTSGGNLWVQDLSEIRLGYNGFFSTIKNNTGAGPLLLTPTAGYNITMNGETNFVGKIGPNADNTYSNGYAGRRWSEVFAANGTINTSDENEKQDIAPVSDAVLRAWSKVEFYQFKFKDAVEKKGDAARTHIGMMAQRIQAAFESEGLDPFAYGLLCFDQWDDQFEDVVVAEKYIDEDGKEQTRGVKTGEKRLVLAAGSRYGIRYEQALALECAYLRSKITGV